MKKLRGFFKGVKKEAKTVRWPDAASMVKYSCVTMMLLVFFGLFFYGLDALFALVRGIF